MREVRNTLFWLPFSSGQRVALCLGCWPSPDSWLKIAIADLYSGAALWVYPRFELARRRNMCWIAVHLATAVLAGMNARAGIRHF